MAKITEQQLLEELRKTLQRLEWLAGAGAAVVKCWPTKRLAYAVNDLDSEVHVTRQFIRNFQRRMKRIAAKAAPQAAAGD